MKCILQGTICMKVQQAKNMNIYTRIQFLLDRTRGPCLPRLPLPPAVFGACVWDRGIDEVQLIMRPPRGMV